MIEWIMNNSKKKNKWASNNTKSRQYQQNEKKSLVIEQNQQGGGLLGRHQLGHDGQELFDGVAATEHNGHRIEQVQGGAERRRRPAHQRLHQRNQQLDAGRTRQLGQHPSGGAEIGARDVHQPAQLIGHAEHCVELGRKGDERHHGLQQLVSRWRR